MSTKKQKHGKHWTFENPERIQAYQELRRSNAAGTHPAPAHKGSRGSRKRRAIRDLDEPVTDLH